MHELSKADANEALTRARGSLARLRAQSAAMTARVTRLGGMVAGGALSGFLNVKMPFVPGTRVDSGKAVGGALALVAVSGWISDETTNELLLGAAGGILAAEACDTVRNAMLQPALPQTAPAAPANR